jgi:SAM-dependent methyltransferase
VLDYTREAAAYDATRGGIPRAQAAADAIGSLLPRGTRGLLDVAGGTGLVASVLAERGVDPVVVDRAPGMAVLAGSRLPGRVVLGDATALPFADASCAAVTMIWLLHLIPREASAVAIAEAARVLRPGGVLVVTVDKNDGQYLADEEIGEILWPQRVRLFHPNPDDRDRIAGLGASHGLGVTGEGVFLGSGQGFSPEHWRRTLGDPGSGWERRGGAALVRELTARVGALSDQDRRRADPVYRLLAMTKG